MTLQPPVCAECRAESVIEDAVRRLGSSVSEQICAAALCQPLAEHHLIGAYLRRHAVGEHRVFNLADKLQASVALRRDDMAQDAIIRLQIRLGDAEGYVVRILSFCKAELTRRLIFTVESNIIRSRRQPDQALIIVCSILGESDEIASVRLLLDGFDIGIQFTCIPQNTVDRLIFRRKNNRLGMRNGDVKLIFCNVLFF